MKKLFYLIFYSFLFFLLFQQKNNIVSTANYLLASPCDTPISYHIGKLDEGYGLTREQFLTNIKQASQIWNNIVGKNLFEYDQQGKIAINLVYSERQSMIDKLNSLDNKLKTGKQTLNSSFTEYKNLQADFEKKMQAFNSEVDSWNKKGGAPEDVYNRLKSQEVELKNEADKLNQMASQLNLSSQQYNLEVSQFNQSAQNFNKEIVNKPEAGLYDSSVPEIDIYLTTSPNELTHTLAHEMGHALDLPHNEDPNAIMYSFTSEIIKPDNLETSQLQSYCKNRNIDIIREVISKNLQEEFSKL